MRPDETEEEHTVTVVVDTRKRFVVLGGFGEEGKTTEILDPETMKFTLGPSLGGERHASAVAPLGKRRALVRDQCKQGHVRDPGPGQLHERAGAEAW